jgi:hypothetical protein
MARLSKNTGNKHSISALTDQDMVNLYHCLPSGGLKDQIKAHLIDCVDDSELEGSGADTAEEFVNNWLGDVK